jgi:hypothetical protein
MTEVTYELIGEHEPELLALIDALSDKRLGLRPTLDRVVLYAGDARTVVAEQGEHPLKRDERAGRFVERFERNQVGFGKSPQDVAAQAAYEAEVLAIKERTAEAWKQQKSVRSKMKQLQKVRK